MENLLCPHCGALAADCLCRPQQAGSRALRHALGSFATGVAVVTIIDPEGQPRGLTINSFASVSLEPPLVLWSLGNNAGDFSSYVAASHFCIHILSAEQEWLSNRFASAGNERFAGLEWQPGLGGVPLLPGALAWFEVKNSLQYPGGDHLIFIGEVERFHAAPGGDPLLFHAGAYRRLAGADD